MSRLAKVWEAITKLQPYADSLGEGEAWRDACIGQSRDAIYTAFTRVDTHRNRTGKMLANVMYNAWAAASDTAKSANLISFVDGVCKLAEDTFIKLEGVKHEEK